MALNPGQPGTRKKNKFTHSLSVFTKNTVAIARKKYKKQAMQANKQANKKLNYSIKLISFVNKFPLNKV